MAKTIPADVLTKIIEHRPHLKITACTKEGIPKFYTARTKRAVNSGGAL